MSPGLAPNDARIAALLAAARAAGIPVQGELDLFAPRCEALRTTSDYAPKVIAITGTNGKTTTTALTALLVERSGKRVAAAGNIGPTMLQTLADAIDAGPAETVRERLPEVWVLELSSFQLAGSAIVRRRCGRAAQSQRRPPRLARLDERLRGREGAGVRRPRDDRASTATTLP